MGRKAPRVCSTAARDSHRIVLTRRSLGRRCCGWCARSTVGRSVSASGRRWRRSTWHRRMGCRWMPKRCDAGCWRKGWRHRRRRERKEHFGEMVQMDGSFHYWLEERGPQGCLMDLVDDATNTTWAQLGEQETIWAVVDALRAWIERYGVPLALYVDWKNLYKRPATPKERLRGEEPITQLARMCATLGLQVIAAITPQSKRRFERQNGTHQDRLVKKLRRKEISSHEHANLYLEREYLAEHNRRFART